MAHVNALTTVSEKFFTPLTSLQMASVKVQAEEPENSKSGNPDSTRRAQDKESTSQKNGYSLKLYRPPLSFPSQAIPGEQILEYKKFMEHIKALQVNIPFIETKLQIPKYASLLKSLFTSRKDMAEVAEIVWNELPANRGDLGSITIPCQFGNITATCALTDSGASINIMPYSFFKKLDLSDPKPIRMTIHIADKSIIRLRGGCKDFLIKVDKFVFPADFVVLYMEEDLKVTIILGRPFLNTACAIVDV
ncbi:hypothetical protein Lser_V15G12675 [Lactuca serriola]